MQAPSRQCLGELAVREMRPVPIQSVETGMIVSVVLCGQEHLWRVAFRCDRRDGYHLCVDHECILSGLEDAHLRDGRNHTVGWVCAHHGLEVVPDGRKQDRCSISA